MTASHRGPTAVVVGALLTLSLAGCGGEDGARTTVQMLWYGSTSDGNPTYGVTEVDVATRASDSGKPFSVDMSRAGKAGDQWQTAAWTAATVGSMLANADPRGLTVSYRLDESIDGPSAGAALTTGVLADLIESADLPATMTMTGTVLPSGAIGPVGGIPAKLRAAAEAGITTVLVPEGQRIAVDPSTGQRVALTDLADELGIEVKPVRSVAEAFADATGDRLTDIATNASGGPATVGSASPDTLTAAVAGVFNEATTTTLTQLANLRLTPSPAPALDSEHQRVAAGVSLAATRTPELVAEGRLVEAYARASLAQREALAWNARAATFLAATTDLAGTITRLAAAAEALAATADAAIDAAGGMPITTVEQTSATPDAICWATDAWANAQVIAAGLTTGSAVSPDQVAAVAGLLAAARYDVQSYVPFSLRVAQSVGTTDITDEGATSQVLTAYADLLADTGDAVAADARRLPSLQDTSGTRVLEDPLAWEYAVMSALADRWHDAVDSTSAAVSTAMSYYVSASTLAATSQLARVQGNRQEFSRSDWDMQVDVASLETRRSSYLADSAGVNPDYLAWNEGFGRGVATAADAIGATDELRLGGLQVQWYGNVQGHLLLTLARVQSGAR